MSEADSEVGLRRRAERRVRARFGFWIHLGVYLVVNACLVTINLVTTPGLLWSVFPAVGWGVGLVAHGVAVFATLSGVRENAIEAEMRRLRGLK